MCLNWSLCRYSTAMQVYKYPLPSSVYIPVLCLLFTFNHPWTDVNETARKEYIVSIVKLILLKNPFTPTMICTKRSPHENEIPSLTWMNSRLILSLSLLQFAIQEYKFPNHGLAWLSSKETLFSIKRYILQTWDRGADFEVQYLPEYCFFFLHSHRVICMYQPETLKRK
jgi:hypothetical protein